MASLWRNLRRAAHVRALTVAERLVPPSDDGLPLPPALMRDKVVKGVFQPAKFLREGQAVARAITSFLAANGVPVTAGERVFEWGCGCGRVVRHLRKLGLVIEGSDVDAELVEWCRAHIDPAAFLVNGYLPPLSAPNNSYDLVYSISVFTHITQEAADAWIRELARIAKPGGRIVISLLPGKGGQGVTEEDRPDLGIKRDWLGKDGAPEVYLNTFHDTHWVQERWRDVVRLQAVQELAIRGRQNLLLFRPVKRS